MSGSEPGPLKLFAGARWLGVAAALALFAGGCSGPLKTDYQKLQESRASYIAAHADLSDATKAAIRDGELRAGMTSEQVMAAWGRPVYVNRFDGGRQIEWLFGCEYPHGCSIEEIGRLRVTYVFHLSRAYFYDGLLTEWRRA